MIYLDNAATSFKKPFLVYPAILINSVKNSANAGRGGHFYSLRASAKIYETTESLCRLFNIPQPENICYTQNATHALNIGILGMLDDTSHVIITQMEHNSVLRPVNRLCKYTVVNANKKGQINIADIEKSIRPDTKMIICTHISNVCGTVMPVEEISKIAKKHNIFFMLDASQSAGNTPIDVLALNVDLMAFSGHKGLMMPMGTGGLYVKENTPIKPFITGGTGSYSAMLTQPDIMPDMLQSGTLNAPAIISAKKSVDFIIRHTPAAIGEKEKYLALKFIEKIKNMNNVELLGLEDGDRGGTVAFNIKNCDSIYISEILNDRFHICTRGGWHCAYPSHIALGSEKTGAVRASFGYFNNLRHVNKLADAVYSLSKE